MLPTIDICVTSIVQGSAVLPTIDICVTSIVPSSAVLPTLDICVTSIVPSSALLPTLDILCKLLQSPANPAKFRVKLYWRITGAQ